MPQFDNPNQQRLYAGVPDEQVEELFDFRAAHQLQSFTHERLNWQYIDAGEGGETVLLFPGATGLAESAWQTIRRLEARFHVVCPSYPPARTMADLAHGAAALLNQLGIDKAHVVGGSYGGFVAQAFAHLHPEHTRSLVISHAGPPEPERGAQISKVMRWLRLLPFWMIQSVFQRRQLSLLPAGNPDAALATAFFNDLILNRLTKKDIIAAYDRTVDFDLNYQFQPADLSGLGERVLLLIAEDDPATPPEAVREMQRLYPSARLVTFSGSGHATALLQPEAYYGAIESFLQEAAA